MTGKTKLALENTHRYVSESELRKQLLKKGNVQLVKSGFSLFFIDLYRIHGAIPKQHTYIMEMNLKFMNAP